MSVGNGCLRHECLDEGNINLTSHYNRYHPSNDVKSHLPWALNFPDGLFGTSCAEVVWISQSKAAHCPFYWPHVFASMFAVISTSDVIGLSQDVSVG